MKMKLIKSIAEIVGISSIAVGGAYCLMQLFEKEKLYRKASEYFEAGDLHTAFIIFDFLGSYKNSKEYCKLVADKEDERDRRLNDLINENDKITINIDEPEPFILTEEEYDRFRSMLQTASEKRKNKKAEAKKNDLSPIAKAAIESIEKCDARR